MRHLLLFGKRPRRGRVKTRLARRVGPERALALYRALLEDQLRFAGSFAGSACVEWWADGPLDRALDSGLPVAGIGLRLQGRGDLGQRLSRAFAAAARAGARATVVIGADSPTLPAAHVEQAFERLERGVPAVIARAEDGGYVLLGSRGHRPELFDGIPWGSAGVAEATGEAARAAGIALEELPPWFDVDDEAGLARLAAALVDGGLTERAPATRGVLLDSSFSGVL